MSLTIGSLFSVKLRPDKRRTWDELDLERAIAAYLAGDVSVRQVHGAFGIPMSSFLRHAKVLGVPIAAPGCAGLTGEKHPTWKGGTRIDRDGYVRTYDPSHPWPRKGGYVLEHVRVMELHIGRRIAGDECVHHINHDRKDNRLENLEVMDRGEHSSLHRLHDTHKRRRKADGTFAPKGGA